MTAASSTLLPIVLYLALSFVVALWAGKLSRKHENASGFLEEYFLGSRSMGGFVLAMTVVLPTGEVTQFGQCQQFQRRAWGGLYRGSELGPAGHDPDAHRLPDHRGLGQTLRHGSPGHECRDHHRLPARPLWQ